MIGTVNVANIAQKSTLMNTLSTSLAAGSCLGGFPIVNCTFTAVSADLENNKSQTPTEDFSEAKRYRDIAIIVGVVIPSGLSNFYIIPSYYIYRHVCSLQKRNYLWE